MFVHAALHRLAKDIPSSLCLCCADCMLYLSMESPSGHSIWSRCRVFIMQEGERCTQHVVVQVTGSLRIPEELQWQASQGTPPGKALHKAPWYLADSKQTHSQAHQKHREADQIQGDNLKRTCEMSSLLLFAQFGIRPTSFLYLVLSIVAHTDGTNGYT